jgi:hypothetical protein
MDHSPQAYRLEIEPSSEGKKERKKERKKEKRKRKKKPLTLERAQLGMPPSLFTVAGYDSICRRVGSPTRLQTSQREV